MTITRRPSTILKLYEQIPDLYKKVNVANIPQVGEGFFARRDIWITPDQFEALKKMDDMGVEIQFEQFPGDGQPTVFFKDIKDKH